MRWTDDIETGGQRAKQARQVRVSQVTQVQPLGSHGNYVSVALEFTVNNESADVIHDVKVRLSVEPAEALWEPGVFEAENLLFASGHHETYTHTARIKLVEGTQHIMECVAAPTVEFTDIEGRRWRRGRDYRLSQLE